MVRENAGSDRRWSAGNAAQNQDIRRLLSPTIRWLAARHRVLLRQVLGPEADRIMARLEAETPEIEVIVAKRVEAMLPGLLEDEIRLVFEDLASRAEAVGRTLEAERAEDEEAPGDDPSESLPSGGRLAAEEGHRAQPSGQVNGKSDWNSEDSHQIEEVSATAEGASIEPLDAERLDGVEGEAGSHPSDEEDSSPSTDDLYEGTVGLTVHAVGGIGQVVQFVRRLCGDPEIRLLRMASRAEDSVDILVALRQPVGLTKILPQIDSVSAVEVPPQESGPGSHRMLIVHLKNRPSEKESSPSEPAQPTSEAEQVVA